MSQHCIVSRQECVQSIAVTLSLKVGLRSLPCVRQREKGQRIENYEELWYTNSNIKRNVSNFFEILDGETRKCLLFRHKTCLVYTPQGKSLENSVYFSSYFHRVWAVDHFLLLFGRKTEDIYSSEHTLMESRNMNQIKSHVVIRLPLEPLH